jgi:hypothetical protein
MKLVVLALAVASLAAAMPIVGLYGTGLSTTGTLVSGGIQEANWDISAGPGGAATPYVTAANWWFSPFAPRFPLDGTAWAANTLTSQWISPQDAYGNNPVIPDAAGSYTYQTTFTIGGGLDPNSATFDYALAADNTVLDVLLNGQSIGGAGTGFASLSGIFTAAGAGLFQSGINTLQVVLNNEGGLDENPSGLQFQILSSDVQALGQVPEPGTYALVGMALLGLQVLRRRR